MAGMLASEETAALVRLRCEGCGWQLETERMAATGRLPVWLIRTSDRPPDMAIHSHGRSDLLKAVEILCRPHIEDSGCASRMLRELASGSEPAEPATAAEARQLSLRLPTG